MSSNLGDIIVSLGIDSRKWYEEAAKLGTSAKGLGGKINDGLTGGGRGLGSSLVGGIAQSFQAGASGGLEGAVSAGVGAIASRISGLGGPWGIAIGAGVGILADQLIPKLLNSRSAMDDFSKSIETNISAMERRNRTAFERIDFEDRLGRLGEKGSRLEIEDAKRSKEIESKKLRFELVDLEGELADAVHKGLKLGGIESRDPAKRGLFTDYGLLRDDAKLTLDKDVLGKGADDIASMLERRVEIGRSLTRLTGDAFRLETLVPGSIERTERERRKLEADAFRKADPLVGGVGQLEKITDLVSTGALEKSVGMRAARGVFEDYKRSNLFSTENLKNDAAVAGTTSGFSALQASLRGREDEMRNSTNKGLQILERMLRGIEAVQKAVESPDEGEDID